MEADTCEGGSGRVSPDEAFAALGSETRLDILLALREAEHLLSFSELFDAVGYSDYSNFDYHLEKLEGPFVRKTEHGYDLTGAGRRIIAAVLSGTVGEEPVIEPTRIDGQCPYCGAPIDMGFQREHVEVYCTECPGVMREAGPKGRYFSSRGLLRHFSLPPAGIAHRSPEEVLAAAWTWGRLNVVADSAGVCSRCSADVEYSVLVCEDHEVVDGYCDRCDRRYAVRFSINCRNCHYTIHRLATEYLLARTEVLAFLTTHGINPLVPENLDRALAAVTDYEEQLLSTDPFEARFTITVDGASITLTVDEALSVTDVTRNDSSDHGC